MVYHALKIYYAKDIVFEKEKPMDMLHWVNSPFFTLRTV